MSLDACTTQKPHQDFLNPQYSQCDVHLVFVEVLLAFVGRYLSERRWSHGCLPCGDSS